MGLGLQQPASAHQNATDQVLAEKMRDWYVHNVGQGDPGNKMQPWAREFNGRADVTVATNKRVPYLNLQNGNWTYFQATEGSSFLRNAAGQAFGLARAEIRHSARLANGLPDQTTLQANIGWTSAKMPACAQSGAARIWAERWLYDGSLSVDDRPRLLNVATAKSHPIVTVVQDGSGRLNFRLEPRFHLNQAGISMLQTVFGRSELWGSQQRFNFLVWPGVSKRTRCTRAPVDLTGVFWRARLAKIPKIFATLYDALPTQMLPISSLTTGEAEDQRWTSNYGPSVNLFAGVSFARCFRSVRETIVWQTVIDEENDQQLRKTQLVYTQLDATGTLVETPNSFRGNDPNNYVARGSLPFLTSQQQVESKTVVNMVSAHVTDEDDGPAFDEERMAVTKAQVAAHHRLLGGVSFAPQQTRLWQEGALQWERVGDESNLNAAAIFAASEHVRGVMFSLGTAKETRSEHVPSLIGRLLHQMGLSLSRQQDLLELHFERLRAAADVPLPRRPDKLVEGPPTPATRRPGMFDRLRAWLMALLHRLGLVRLDPASSAATGSGAGRDNDACIGRAMASSNHKTTVVAAVPAEVLLNSAIELRRQADEGSVTGTASKISLPIVFHLDQKTKGQGAAAQQMQRRLADAFDDLLGTQFSAFPRLSASSAQPQDRTLRAEYRWDSLADLQVDLAHGLRPEDEMGVPQHWRANRFGVDFAALVALRDACAVDRRVSNSPGLNGQYHFGAHLAFARAVNAFLSDERAVDLGRASAHARHSFTGLDSKTTKRAFLLACFVELAQKGRHARKDSPRQRTIRPVYSTQMPRAGAANKPLRWQLSRDIHEINENRQATASAQAMYQVARRVLSSVNRAVSDLKFFEEESAWLEELNRHLPNQGRAANDWLNTTTAPIRSTTKSYVGLLTDCLQRRSASASRQMLAALTSRTSGEEDVEALVRLALTLSPAALDANLREYSLLALCSEIEIHIGLIASDVKRSGPCAGEISALRRREQHLSVRSLKVLAHAFRFASAAHTSNTAPFERLERVASAWSYGHDRQAFPQEVHAEAQECVRVAARAFLAVRRRTPRATAA